MSPDQGWKTSRDGACGCASTAATAYHTVLIDLANHPMVEQRHQAIAAAFRDQAAEADRQAAEADRQAAEADRQAALWQRGHT